MAGNRNANVLPEPVCAMPIRSWPVKAIDHPCAWIAVGPLKPALSNKSMSCLGKH